MTLNFEYTNAFYYLLLLMILDSSKLTNENAEKEEFEHKQTELESVCKSLLTPPSMETSPEDDDNNNTEPVVENID